MARYSVAASIGNAIRSRPPSNPQPHSTFFGSAGKGIPIVFVAAPPAFVSQQCFANGLRRIPAANRPQRNSR
jgi:hypothetical protein